MYIQQFLYFAYFGVLYLNCFALVVGLFLGDNTDENIVIDMIHLVEH
jgi:hypothetical protein